MKHRILKNIVIATFVWTLSSCIAQPRITFITPITPQDLIEPYLTEMMNKGIFNDIELIIISADPTDEQRSIIDEYQYVFENIVFITGSGKQTTTALFNQAIKKAKAPFISYLNSDDYRPEQLCLAQVECLEKNANIDIVYSDYYSSYDRNIPTSKADNWYLISLPEFQPHLMYQNQCGFHLMWRKSVHENNGYFIESFQFNYLWEFWNRCAKNGAHFKKVKGEPATHYFNYFNQKKIFHTTDDYAKSTQEELLIRQAYRSMWSCSTDDQKHFVIITASYNNKAWLAWNLDSTLNQNYTNYRIIYIDDRSNDQTGRLVQEYAQSINKEHLIKVIINTEQKGALANIYEAVHSCKPDEIVLLVDGDDALINDDVLKYLNQVYQDPNIWLTYGQFEWFPAHMQGFASQIPTWVIEQNSIRNYRWVTTHLRTFYAGLFHKIKKEDLMFENRFCAMAWDLALMYPLVEMAAFHTKFIDQILIKYNNGTAINDNRTNADLQNKIDLYVRKQAPYKPISHFMD